ncbi:renin receptor-like [Ctenocephalides felis]|uniref:renin receptor-like n=1 Tax=Ctenocephalides felis TaxID=7515 RepID=UPI000E6E426E|nr:renin receptor-like [Ctenocephalides felis]
MWQKVLIYLLPLVASIYCNGELSVLNSPNGIQFQGETPLPQSLLKELYSVALGLTSEQSSAEWDGVSKLNPFQLPKAVVTVVVEGTDKLSLDSKNTYPLVVDEELDNTWDSLDKRFKERYPFDDLTLVNLELPNGNVNSERVFGVVSPKPVQSDLPEKFVKDLGVLNALSDKVLELTPDERPSLFFFRLSTNFKSPEDTDKAKTELTKAIKTLSEAFDKTYKGKVLFTVLTSNDVLTRKTRQADDAPKEPDFNLAKEYNDSYPVVFNIILWFGVAFFFSLLAICISISTMDPGRDSIIYRMTSTRIKKEN